MLTQKVPRSVPLSIEATPQPLVVLCGPTAVGKTTVAKELAKTASLLRVVGSDGLVAALGGASTSERLLSWLDFESANDRSIRPDMDREVDLTLLRDLAADPRPKVVESVVLPMLLPVDNTALIIRLVASQPVRARRVCGLLPDVTFPQARTIVDRKDFATCVALRSSWGIDIAERSAPGWRTDLSVGCPHEAECPNETACTDTVTALVRGAFAVYQCFLTGGPQPETADAAAEFFVLSRAHQDYMGRCTPLLLGYGGEHTTRRWRHRLLFELETRSGLL